MNIDRSISGLLIFPEARTNKAGVHTKRRPNRMLLNASLLINRSNKDYCLYDFPENIEKIPQHHAGFPLPEKDFTRGDCTNQIS